MPREAGGWLKEDALKTAGIGEAWAKEVGSKQHEVTLRHDPRQGGYVTQHVILDFDTTFREVHAWQMGSDLHAARRQFRTIVQGLGGKA